MDDPPGDADPPPPMVEAPVTLGSSAPVVDNPSAVDAPVAETPAAEAPASQLPPRADGIAKRHRNNGRGNNASTAGGRNRTKRGGTSSSLQLPQLKLTIRNIGDVERHGTVAELLNMVRALIGAVNADASGGTPISLDESSIQRLIRAEELATAAAAEHQASKESSEVMETVDEVDAGQSEAALDEDVKPEGAKTEVEVKPADDVKEEIKRSGPAFADVVLGSSEEPVTPENSNVVSARVLYVVPPKKSRRRGEKNGCAYLVLSPPRTLSKTSPEQPESIMTPAERSRAVAKARLVLLHTLGAISQKAQADARASQLYGGCLVEQSLNVKTWRDRERNHRDRREGTIQQTADYRRFIANIEQAEQDRLNRPKPAPGGGSIAVGTETSQESGQRVAALVLHLRAKHDAQKARRKKAPSTGKKRLDSNDNKSKRKGRREQPKKGSSRGAARKDRGRARNRSKKAPLSTSTVAPTLLKSSNGAAGKANGTG